MSRKQRGGADHFQRFGEGLRLAKDKMNEKNLYFVNPSFDK
mgnify:CR=1 FL=1